MKVGFDAKRLFNNFTGLGNYSRFVVNALSEHYPDNEYLLYSPKLRKHPDVEGVLALKNVILRKPAYLTNTFQLGAVWRSYCLGAISQRDGAEIFHGLSNELPLTKPKGLRTVVTVHDLIFKRYPEFYNPMDVKLYTWKLRMACKTADRIIAVSEQTADDLVEYFRVDRAKLRIVYQGCHSNFKKSFTAQQLERIKEKYQLPANFALQVGTIEARKNAMLLLQALVHLPQEFVAVFIGRPTSYMGTLNQFIEKHDLSQRVKFIHDADFDDLPLIYRLAKVFVYPSLFEGFGIPIVEAIACNVPVIAATGSCLKEAGGPNCIYVNPFAPQELALAIESVISQPRRAQEMTDKSGAYIKRFDPAEIAAGIMKVYSELV